jgi:hypothetical protein
MYMSIPLLPLLPLFLFPLTWNPPSCDRIRRPLLWVACKLTPVFPSPAHLAPYPKSRPPGVSQTRNRHSLGRHCEPNPYARLQFLVIESTCGIHSIKDIQSTTYCTCDPTIWIMFSSKFCSRIRIPALSSV